MKSSAGIFEQEIRDLCEWAVPFQPLRGLVMVKALWSGRGSLDLRRTMIVVPESAKKRNQPLTVAVVLNPGQGYMDLETGKHYGSPLQPGDVILAEQFVAYEMNIGERKFNYIPESKICAHVSGITLTEFLGQVCHD